MANETSKSSWLGMGLSLLGGMALGALGAALVIRFLPGVWGTITGANKPQA